MIFRSINIRKRPITEEFGIFLALVVSHVRRENQFSGKGVGKSTNRAQKSEINERGT